jgi:hypothetical protein
MTDRAARIARLIDKIARVTTTRGATPREAEAAAAKLDRLRELYAADAYVSVPYTAWRAWYAAGTNRRRSGRVPVTRYVLPGIEAACNVVAAWDKRSGELAFCGAGGDNLRAHAWQEAIRSAIDVAYAAYAARAPRVPGETGAARSARFKRAMAERINERLLALADDRDAYRARLRAAFAEHYDSRGCAGSTLITTPSLTSSAGAGAGDRIALSRGATDPIATTTERLEGPTE